MMRDDNPNVTDEEIQTVTARIRPVLVWKRATVGVRISEGVESDPVKGADRLVRRMTGRAGGRPPGLTNISDDEQLRGPIREMRRDRVRVTQKTVAARSSLTLADIRGYLKATRRTWAEFLRSF